MIQEIELFILFVIGFFALGMASIGIRYILQLFEDVACLNRGVNHGKKGDFYWLNFPRQ